MARWVTHRTDATAKPLIKYAESIGLTYVALGGAIDGLLSWGSRIAAIEWKSKGGTLTPTQAKIVATGFPLRFVSTPEQVDQVKLELQRSQ
jgi:hypothetical protein